MSSAQSLPRPEPQRADPYIVEQLDARLSVDFYRCLERYMGGGPDKCAAAFRSQWETWWRQHAATRADWFRGDMLNRIQHRQPLRGRRVLDFGCGTGSSTLVFAEAGAEVTGVEPDAISLAVAQARLRDCGFERTVLKQIPFLTGGEERLPFADASFDTVALIGVVEHMLPRELAHCFAEVRRLVRSGGEVFLYDTPNRLFPFDAHTVRLWFSNWLPAGLARRYAVLRGRMTMDADFLRRGGVGISRRTITRLLGRDFDRVYQKSTADVQADFVWVARDIPWLWRRAPRLAERLMKHACRALCAMGRAIGSDHGAWPMNHVLLYARR
jgi:SAM-dependent methyltransferase